MARRCEICGKGPKKAASRSHSKIKTLRKQYPNLQIKTVDGKRKKICTTCLKTINRKGAVKKKK
ncbi:MAG: 50S ribosomal protein L28 [Patescibacteria group bacterium]